MVLDLEEVILKTHVCGLLLHHYYLYYYHCYHCILLKESLVDLKMF
jgi:hypothetical protein